MGAEWIGQKGIDRQFIVMKPMNTRVILRGLESFGRLLQTKAEPLTPIKTGALKRAVVAPEALQVAKNGPDKVAMTITVKEPYAKIQHENTSFVHPIAGQAKYLEKPLDQNKNKLESIFKRAFDAIFG